MSVILYYLRQVCNNNRSRVNKRISCDFRTKLVLLGNPLCGNVERRLNGVDTVNLSCNASAVESKIVVHKDFRMSNNLALDFLFLIF